MTLPLPPNLLARTGAGLASLLLALTLTACGGGSGGSGGGGTVLPPVDTSAVAMADPGSLLAANWQHGTFMEIFVRGYKDSDGDGIGDLKGLTSRLDYLKDLGVSGLWLMPITASQDHDHGYAVADFRAIETPYGSLADLDELLRQAHARGIGVVLDYVMNHSAAQNPLFLNSRDAADNLYRNWYVWQDTHPSGWSIYGGDPWRTAANGAYFAPFWDQMPDFNLLNPSVVAYHRDNLRFWLNRGVDGFRFDAVGNLVEHGPSAWENQPENYTLMTGVRGLLNGYAQRYMVCEAPADPAGFGAACGSAFAFDHRADIVNAAKGDAFSIGRVADYFKTASANQATMVSNHDSFAGQRLFDQVVGNLAQYRLAAATYLLQPGIPFIYYGEEVGMAGGSGLSGDAQLRTPMSWTGHTGNAGFTTGTPFRVPSGNVASFNAEAAASDPASLLAFYKSMLALRKNSAALARGSYEAPVVSGKVFSFQRHLGTEHALVVLNYGPGGTMTPLAGLPANATLHVASAWPTGGSATMSTDAAGKGQWMAAAQSVTVFNY
jgi:glycosidase